jgi:anti-sigma factor RsiW
MNQPQCRQLEDYLARSLSNAERAEFAAHLAGCPACHQAIREQELMDQMLLRAATLLQPVSASLAEQTERRLQRAHRLRFTRWASGLAAAVVLMCITAWLLTREPSQELSPVRIVEAPALQSTPVVHDPRSLVRVTFQPQAAVLAVPMKTENPNVTIIWVYPTVPTAAEPEAVPSLERNGT